MTPAGVLESAIFLGLFVLAGGAYGALYSIGRLRARRAMVHAGRACWVIAFALALAIALVTPLDWGWKLLILVSALAYAMIPPITWRYLEREHANATQTEVSR